VRVVAHLLVILAVVGPALAGCGSDDDGDGNGAGGTTPTRPLASAPSAPPPPTDGAPSSTAPRDGAAPADGGEEPVRTPAEFVFLSGGRVDPPTITVPPFIPVEVTLVSRDGRTHALALDAGRRYEFRVGPGGRSTGRLPGLRVGSYRLRPIGGGPGATLVVSNEPAGP
jgi:hypothetical protein